MKTTISSNIRIIKSPLRVDGSPYFLRNIFLDLWLSSTVWLLLNFGPNGYGSFGNFRLFLSFCFWETKTSKDANKILWFYRGVKLMSLLAYWYRVNYQMYLTNVELFVFLQMFLSLLRPMIKFTFHLLSRPLQIR